MVGNNHEVLLGVFQGDNLKILALSLEEPNKGQVRLGLDVNSGDLVAVQTEVLRGL